MSHAIESVEVNGIELFLKNPVQQVLAKLTNKPTLIAMIVLRLDKDIKSPLGPVFKRSLVVGSLIFGSSIAMELEAKAKADLPVKTIDHGAGFKPTRAPYHTAVMHNGYPTPLHVNIKDPTKFYVCLDQMKGPEKATYWTEIGEQIPTEQIAPLLKQATDTGDVNYRLYSAENVKVFALCPAPTNYADVPAELIKLAAAIEGK